MNLDELKEKIRSLGYTIPELLAHRSETYANRDAKRKQQQQQPTVFESEVEGLF